MPREPHRTVTEQEVRKLQRAAAEQPGVKELLEVHRHNDQVLRAVSYVAREDRITISTLSDSTS